MQQNVSYAEKEEHHSNQTSLIKLLFIESFAN